MPRYGNAPWSTNSPEVEAECRRMEDEHERDLENKWDALCEKQDHFARIEEQKTHYENILELPNMRAFMNRMLSAMDKWQDAESENEPYESDAYKYFDKLYKTLITLLEPKYGFYKAVNLVDELIRYMEIGEVPENKYDHLYK